MKSLEQALAELEGAVKAAPFSAPGVPPPSLTVGEVRQEILRDSDGRIRQILVTNADNSVTRKIIERDRDHRICRVIESTSPPLVQRASPAKSADDDVSTDDLIEGLRKRSAALRAEDRASSTRTCTATPKVAKKPEPRGQAFTLPGLVLPGAAPARKRRSWKKLDAAQKSAHAEVFRKFVAKAVAKAVVEGR